MKTYIKQNKHLFFLSILVSIVASLGYVFMAILLQQLLDIAVAKNLHQFIKLISFSIIYFAALGVFLYLQSLLSKKVICKIIYQVRSDIFRGTINHSIEDFENNNTADFISIITNDVKMIEDNYLLPLFEIVKYTVIFISSFMLMIYFDIIVTAFVVLSIVIMFIVPSFLGSLLEKKQNIFSSKLADFTITLKDILSGFEIIKSYSMKSYVLHRFDKENNETISSKYKVERLLALNEGLSSFLALIVQIVVLFLSAYFIITGRITVGTLLGMVQVSSNLANPLIMIFTNIPKIKSMFPIIKKIENISNYSIESLENKETASFNNSICINNLSFSYDGQNEILTDTNWTIEKSKKYAVIGKSGCGKSTLIKLLVGYYSDYKGLIKYDDMELSSIDKDSLSNLSSIIHQNIYMFNETIYDNICLHENYTDETIDKALIKSGLSEFISEIPEGLLYNVGENGSNLSGGQKQRIAVARALIRNKPILILDEGTSAIDKQTAYDIENRLLNIENLTLITITHNLEKELLEKYDEVVYIENSSIKEHGNFKKLIEKSQAFSKYFYLKK